MLNRPHRILIVDDEAQIREILQRYLEILGYEVELAQDGFEALAKLDFEIDLVMLDVEMPGMDGYDIARQIRTDDRHYDLPIIFVTGLSSLEERLRAVEAGGNDFIAKPFDTTEIKVRISSLLKIKSTNDELKRYKCELEKTVATRTAALRRALESMVDTQRLLQEANQETIYCLVAAAEFKDQNTAGHIQRMSLYSGLIARKLKLPPSEVELIQHASPMHDIGKIGTPEDILLKPGKLTKDEFEIIKQHPLYGSQILTKSKSPLLKIGCEISLTHHEKWDGNGYPNGVAGEEIPICGRICAVADVFDALTSVRPYKMAFSNEKALEIIDFENGKQFDPKIVNVLTENLDDFVQIQNNLRHNKEFYSVRTG